MYFNMRIFNFMLSLLVLVSFAGSCSGQHESYMDISPAPFIKTFSTEYAGKAAYDIPVVIEGANFNPDPAKNSIVLGVGMHAVEYPASEASENRIVFNAPYSEDQKVLMKLRSDGAESNPVYLEYDRVKTDSLFLLNDAAIRKLRPGVTWANIYKEWAGAIRSIKHVTIELSAKNRINIACPTTNTRTSEQCLKYGAFLGVNGSYFSSTYVRVDGQMIRPGKDQGVDVFMRDGVFTIDDNVPGMAYVGSNERASRLPNRNLMTCGPLLILNDKHREMAAGSHNETTHPRTGVGITKDGRVILVTVDGRFVDKAVGMPTTLFARLMDAFGAEHALNLDGGGSTTMWIEGLGIVNHPCDDRNWDNPVERKIGSILYLK